MVANLDNAKDYSNGKSSKPQQQRQQQPKAQQEPQPLALPNQSMVLFQQLKTATQADMAAIDRMFDKRREVVASHYDRRAEQFGNEMAEQFGVKVDDDFFSQPMTLEAALAEFDSLLEPSEETEAPELQQSPSTSAPAADRVIETTAKQLA